MKKNAGENDFGLQYLKTEKINSRSSDTTNGMQAKKKKLSNLCDKTCNSVEDNR